MDTEEINQALDRLNELYDEYPKEGLFFSKLALLELGGWLEETHDDIGKNLFKQLIKNPSIQGNIILKPEVEKCEKDILAKMDKIYGFSYKEHLKPLLIQILGSLILLKIEQKVGFSNINTANSKLQNLYNTRNILAHKSTGQANISIHGHKNKELQKYIAAPSSLKGELKWLDEEFLSKLKEELDLFVEQFINESTVA